MIRILTIATLVFFSPALVAAGWVPADCGDRGDEWKKFHQLFGRKEVEKVWQDYRQSVLKAQPGSPLYVPFPYPRNQKEIVRNFRYAYFGMLYGGVPGYRFLRLLFESLPWYKVPARERPVYSALKEDSLRVEILRVENWEMTRCTGATPGPFYYMLRLYDPRGTEVARSMQSDAGHMALYCHASPRQKTIPPLGDLSTLLRTRFGLTTPVEQPQYVTVDGLPYCGQLTPCIAFKSQGKVYLLDGGELLYGIEPTTPRMSLMAFREQRLGEGLRPLGVIEWETPMVTLGFEWARARLIGGRKPD